MSDGPLKIQDCMLPSLRRFHKMLRQQTDFGVRYRVLAFLSC